MLRFTKNGSLITKRIRRSPPATNQQPQKLILQIQPPLKRLDSTASSHSQASSSMLPPIPRPILKPPKKPSASSVSGGNASGNRAITHSDASGGGRVQGSAGDEDTGARNIPPSKPKLTLKLKVGGGGMASRMPKG